nr:hypothetical protein Iba_chr07bCG5160 [Ipomoea batatas]
MEILSGVQNLRCMAMVLSANPRRMRKLSMYQPGPA